LVGFIRVNPLFPCASVCYSGLGRAVRAPCPTVVHSAHLHFGHCFATPYIPHIPNTCVCCLTSAVCLGAVGWREYLRLSCRFCVIPDRQYSTESKIREPCHSRPLSVAECSVCCMAFLPFPFFPCSFVWPKEPKATGAKPCEKLYPGRRVSSVLRFSCSTVVHSTYLHLGHLPAGIDSLSIPTLASAVCRLPFAWGLEGWEGICKSSVCPPGRGMGPVSALRHPAGVPGGLVCGLRRGLDDLPTHISLAFHARVAYP